MALASSPNLTNDAVSTAYTTETAFGAEVITAATGVATLTVHYDAASASYVLTMAGDSETFSPAELPSAPAGGHSQYVNGSDSLDLYASSSSGVAYSYGGMGAWKQAANTASGQSLNYTPFTYGLQTSAASMPRAGSAEYAIDLIGLASEINQTPIELDGTGTFDVDFLSGVFAARINIVYDAATSSGVISGGDSGLTAQGYLSDSDSTFSGQEKLLAPIGSVVTGPLAGRFYGPSGQELGATFSGNDGMGTTVAGAIYGTYESPATQNLALTNIIVNQEFTDSWASGLQSEIAASGSGMTVNSQLPYPNVTYLTLGTDGSVGFLAGDNVGTGVTFTSADQVASSRPNFTTYQKTVSGEPAELDVYEVGPSNSELDLTYTSFAMWSQGTTQPGSQYNQAYTSYGLATDSDILHGMTGQATYNGVAYGGATDGTLGTRYNLSGTSSFDVDFSNHAYTGSLSLNGTGLDGAANRNFGAFTFSGVISATSYPVANFGTFNLTNAYGSLAIQFNGPKAEEIGGTFSMDLSNISAQPGDTLLSGVVAAKRN